FSMRYGVLSVKALVELAITHEIPSLALTDIHNVSACFDFIKRCRRNGIHPVVGMEFRVNDKLLYIALARNQAGFQEINAFYSQYAHIGEPFPEIAPLWNNVYVIYPWNRRDRSTLSEHEYLGIRHTELNQLVRSRYHHRQDKLVILQPITFLNKRGFNQHRLMRAIDHNIVLSKLSHSQQANEGEAFLSPEKLRKAYEGFPQIINNTEKLLASCQFEFSFEGSHTRQTYTGDKYGDIVLLEQLAMEGMEKRYGLHNTEAAKRLERELQIIDKLNFNAYFLITWDFVKYSQHRGFFHVGRGSGANSLVAYCLGITDVDPLALNLYFERFLNPKRTSPPDFDIDYSWKERDEVIRYVLKRYRESHTAMIATYSTFKERAAIRELGKVFGLPKGEIDKLVGSHQHPPADLSKVEKQLLHYARLMKGFPSHFSVHAGGVLISESPIHAFSPTEIPPKGFPITQFDMYTAEEIGLHKFDILSQRGLGHIKSTVDIIYENHGKSVDIHQISTFTRDTKSQQMLAHGQTMGCFYIESPAMRGLLKKLSCDNYPTLVAASSVIRPGVARSGMMQEFIRRHNGTPFSYPHPKVQELLDDTYGIMIYQEDVLKMVHGYAGLSLAEADLLRRAMSGKSRDNQEFHIIREKFLLAATEKGYEATLNQEIWRQIESFAGYSFSKAHSASFAAESFQSLYLKAHFPLEFIVGVINNFGGFYDTEIYLHEARMYGATVHPPCINTSTYLTRIIGDDIYLGFIHLKDLQKKLAEEIEVERVRRGPFTDMADFTRRVNISVEQMTILIRIGALRFTASTKPALLWEMHLYAKRTFQQQADILFPPDKPDFSLPDLETSSLEDAYDEMELLGFPLASPFSLLGILPEEINLVVTKNFPRHEGQIVHILGYYVCVKTTRTIKGDMMQFANMLDSEGQMFDCTRFPNVVKKYPFIDRGIYLISGKVVNEFGHFTLEMTKMTKLLYLKDPRIQEENRPLRGGIIQTTP
ncbi:MAG: DNA polymerase III subunit alpha, partial [Bacteroidota bacterium]